MQTDAHDWRHCVTRVNGVGLHNVAAGSGEPVVLLHGFPQTWWEWHQVTPALAERRATP